MKMHFLFGVLMGGAALVSAQAAASGERAGAALILAQANIPPTGMGEKDMAMAAAHMAEDERMKRRFPQPIRVGALIGARVGDNDSRTIGYIRHVVRTADGRIDVVVDCCGWFGFGGREVAVPIAVLGALGQEVVSLDMPRSDYASSPTWRSTSDALLGENETVQIALARR